MTSRDYLVRGHMRFSDDELPNLFERYTALVRTSKLYRECTSEKIALATAGDVGAVCKHIAGVKNDVKIGRKLQMEDLLAEALFDVAVLAQKTGYPLEGLMDKKIRQILKFRRRHKRNAIQYIMDNIDVDIDSYSVEDILSILNLTDPSEYQIKDVATIRGEARSGSIFREGEAEGPG